MKKLFIAMFCLLLFFGFVYASPLFSSERQGQFEKIKEMIEGKGGLYEDCDNFRKYVVPEIEKFSLVEDIEEPNEYCNSFALKLKNKPVIFWNNSPYPGKVSRPTTEKYYYDEYGTLKEGIEKIYHKNGNLRYEISYKNGKLDGIEKFYDKSGILRYEISYKNGKLDGIKKEYYESGALQRELPYKDGKPEGISKSYHENGTLRYEIFDKDNKEEWRKLYYNSGALETEISGKNDKTEWVSKHYYESGVLKRETSFKNGEIDGFEREYYETGALKRETFYINGERVR